MVDVAVIDENTVSLDGTLMPIARPVQRFLASIYPGKVVVGDTGRDSNPNASALARSDWSGGIGLFKDTGVSPQPRSRFSTCSLRYKSLTLPGLEVETAASGVAGVFTIGAMGIRANEVYAAFGTEVHKYDNGMDSWGSSLQTLPQGATDAINIRIGGTEYLVFAHTTGYTYFDGTTWTEDTTKTTKYLEFWDDKLYGIGAEGLLWSASTIGTETDAGQLPLPDNYITALFLARDATGTVIIYAGTKVGFFALDSANDKWFRVDGMQQPFHPDGGRGAIQWRDSAYSPAGLGITKYINGTNSAVVTIVGPDRDDGMPSGKGGTIVQLVSSHNDLLAVNDATVVVEEDTLDTQITDGIHQSSVMDPDVGFSSILGLNDSGWEVKFQSLVTDEAINFAIVTNAYDEQRLWFAMGERVSYIRIPAQIINPNEISDLPYAASAEDESPWYNVNQMEVNKNALRLRVETLDLSANDTVKVEIGLDLSDSYTTLGTITTDGVTTFELPNATTPTGTVFLWFRIRITLTRGSTTTITPQMVNWTMEYRKKLPGKRGFSVLVDMNREDFKGSTPEQLLAAIDVATAKDLLVPFLFHSEDDGTETFYVDVSNDSDSLNTGEDHRGNALLQLTQR